MSSSSTPRLESEPGFSYQLGRDLCFLPLQEPELRFGRNLLPGLVLQSARSESSDSLYRQHHRRVSASALSNPHMRFMRLIGDAHPRYQWEQYRKTPEELKGMKKPLFVA